MVQSCMPETPKPTRVSARAWCPEPIVPARIANTSVIAARPIRPYEAGALGPGTESHLALDDCLCADRTELTKKAAIAAACGDDAGILVSFNHRAVKMSAAPVVSEGENTVSLSMLALGGLSAINNPTNMLNAGAPQRPLHNRGVCLGSIATVRFAWLRPLERLFMLAGVADP